ncbi:hypothetical protein QA596_04480 [Balneolales bacterium ANBcel1]|nr:hypothetical protein [Balneolales bacterium ANBcel1]
MSPIMNILDELNATSGKLLELVEDEHSSIDAIEELMQQRGSMIAELDPLTDNVEPSAFTPEEQDTLVEKFRVYRKLHETIQPALEKLMNGKEEVMGDAYKRRRADDRYHLLGTPDISYYQTSK